jgi:5'-nucleotidase
MKKPLIFIGNDDGIDAKGLHTLIELMKPFGRLLVSVPETGQSGQSQALTIGPPLTLTKVKEEENLAIYTCNGTPVDAVKLAMHLVLKEKPALFVSGINHGSNSSISAYYSGTVGTAIETYFHDIPSVAFSITTHDVDADFSIAEKYVGEIVEFVLQSPFKKELCLNVNFPNIAPEEAKGIRFCRQTNGYWREEFEESTNENGQTTYTMLGDFFNNEPSADDTDEWALRHHFVSIVPLSKDLTNYSILNRIKNR